MKKLYYLDESEKQRILNLHESHTKKQYLMNEQSVGSALYATAGAASTGAAIGSVVPVIGTAVGAVVGGAIGLISSIGSGISRETFNSTITSICSIGAGKPTLNGGQLMDIAKQLNDLINTTNYAGVGYATTQSRAGIKQVLGTIPTIPDLCGVMTKYKEIYNIALLADLTREIYKDTNWTDTVKFPLMKAVEKSKELSLQAAQKPAETLVGWDKFPCVTTNPNAKKLSLKDGSVTYEINGFYYYGGGRKMNQSTKEMSDYHCGADGMIKEGPKPAGGSIAAVTATGGGGGSLSTRVSAIQKQLGLAQSGKMDQATINTLMGKIQGGSTTTNNPTTPQSNVVG